MPLTAGHYNVVLRGNYAGTEDLVNSFYFTVDLNGGTLVGDDNELFNLGKRFWDHIKAELRAITATEVSYNAMDVFKADGVDVGNAGFYTIPDDEREGLIDADSLPPSDTWTFQYVRPNANFRHGYKRFSGIPENYQARGIATGLAVTALPALAVKLRTNFNLNAALVLAPFASAALVQRELNGLPVDPDVWYAPSTVIYRKIGTQNSRKYGVGG